MFAILMDNREDLPLAGRRMVIPSVVLQAYLAQAQAERAAALASDALRLLSLSDSKPAAEVGE